VDGVQDPARPRDEGEVDDVRHEADL